MWIGELLLRAISRPLAAGDYTFGAGEQACGTALSLLRKEFPDFSGLIKGKRVVDYGCGTGHQSVALVLEENCRVFGLDTNPRTLEKAKTLALESQIDDARLAFADRISADVLHMYDVVISQNSMEHFQNPAATIEEMKSLLKGGGRILITFGPPWFAPYGSHSHFFCKWPWLNIFLSEKTVMKVRSLYRSDGAKRYEEVESGLNKMTVDKFEKIITRSGLTVSYRRYSCVKRMNWLAKCPIVRELFVNRVSCVLALE